MCVISLVGLCDFHRLRWLVCDMHETLRCSPLHDRWTEDAIKALQEEAEATVIRTLMAANHAAAHAKRVTLKPKDFTLLKEVTKALAGE